MTASSRRLLNSVSGIAIVSLGVFAVTPEAARAEQWLGTVSGDWYDPANWDTGVPAGGADVGINQTLPHPLVVDRGAIDLGGRSIAIGTTADGAMTITGGASLASGQSTLTGDPGSTGVVTVTGTGSLWTTDLTAIGYEGDAILRIEDGGVVRSNSTTVARNGGSGIITVDGIGSRWEITDVNTYFGGFGHAEMTISNGGVVTNSNRVHLGSDIGASGDVVVDGAGSRWEIGENLIIGLNGSGSLSITGGGYAEADIVTLGSHTPGNAASLILDGQGSELRAPGGIQIGFTDEPIMRITDGAKLTTGKPDVNPFIGRSYVGHLQPPGQAASVLISGKGSVWEDAHYIIIGNSFSDGTVTVEAGGALKGQSIDVGRGRGIDRSNPDDPFFSEARLIVSGAGTTVDANWMTLGNAGARATADISGGAVVTTRTTLLGGGFTSTGDRSIIALGDVDVLLGGAGTLWSTADTRAEAFLTDYGNYRIRVSDEALLDVAGGMQLGYRNFDGEESHTQVTVDTAGMVSIGGTASLAFAAGSDAGVTVDGAGSSWTVGGPLIVGEAGTGTLNAANGGRVAASAIEVAREAGSTGVIAVGGLTTAATAGVIDAPTITFGAGAGSLIFNHTGAATLSSALSGNGVVRQLAGRTTLSGDSSGFSGTTFVKGGTLWLSNSLGGRVEVGDGSATTEFSVDPDGNVDGTAIEVAQSAFATFHSDSSARAASITSAGTVNIHAGADLTGARLAASSGGEFIVGFDPFGVETRSFGSIEGAGDFRLSGIGDDDTIEVGSDDRSTTVSGRIYETFDSVGLQKVGDGMLTLAGINGYTGATNIDGGILNVAGSLVSAVNVNAGGTLRGKGSIGSLTVNSGGTFAPGNSIGTMTVVGNASFGAGSTYEAEIAADGTSDLLAVGGTASLAGTLSVLGIAYPVGYPDAQDYTILTADGGVSGTFDRVTDNLPDVDVTATYNAKDVVIGYDKTADTTSAKEIYPNSLQASLGAGRLFAGNLRQRGQLHGLSGQMPGSMVPLAYGPTEGKLSTGNSVTGLPHYGVAAWASVLGLSQNVDAHGGVPGYDAGTYGLASGIDSTFDLGGALGRAGLAFGYTNTDADSGASSADIDAWHVGIYGGVENGPFALSGALSYAWQDYDFSRDIPFIGGGGATAAGESNGKLFAASLEASYDLAERMGIRQDIGFRFAPTVSLDHIHASRDGFTETGAGVLNMVVGGDDISRTWLGAGIAMSTRIVGESGVVFTPELQLMYEHNVGDDRAVTASQIVAATASFTTPGVLEDDDLVSVGAGLGIGFNERTSLKLRYDGSFGSNTQSHRGHIGLSVKF